MPYKDKQSKVGPFRKMLFGPKGKLEMRGRPMPNVGDTLRTPQGTPIRVQRIQNGEYIGNNGKTYIPQIDLPRVTAVQKRHYPAEHLDEGFARLLAAGTILPSTVGLLAAEGTAPIAAMLLSAYPTIEAGLDFRGKGVGPTNKSLEKRRNTYLEHMRQYYTRPVNKGGPGFSEQKADSMAREALNNFSHRYGYYW